MLVSSILANTHHYVVAALLPPGGQSLHYFLLGRYEAYFTGCRGPPSFIFLFGPAVHWLSLGSEAGLPSPSSLVLFLLENKKWGGGGGRALGRHPRPHTTLVDERNTVAMVFTYVKGINFYE